MDEQPATPSRVEDFLVSILHETDEQLDAGRRRALEAGLPPIEVGPGQGKLLMLLARISGARRVLEIGTLGGYSTTWLARGVGPGGVVVTCEFEPLHARIARENLDEAGIGDRVQIRLGAARDTLRQLLTDGVEPFDLVFVDADKENNVHYLEAAIALGRPGTVIVLDNVVRSGSVTMPGDPATQAGRMVQGVRAGLEFLGSDPRVDATALQTTGPKGWDGFALALVR